MLSSVQLQLLLSICTPSSDISFIYAKNSDKTVRANSKDTNQFASEKVISLGSAVFAVLPAF